MHPPYPVTAVRPIRTVAYLAIAGLTLTSLVAVAMIVGELYAIALVHRLRTAPELVAQMEIDTFNNAAALLEKARRYSYILAAVLFLVWLMRARSNAESLVPVPHRHAEAWGIFGWAPVVNLWIPKRFADDIWSASQPGGLRTGSLRTEPRSGLIWAWWLTWLLATYLAMTPRFMAYGVDALGVEISGLALSVAAAVLASAVILKITAAQEIGRRWETSSVISVDS
ncbi:DUF4328 domain-containing protein [Nonomuraea sp. NPDC050556]|uniref:DUF4328 domain-containing protein n=1 Tax=Nonomuraea sp. NPDC050556 TaxID=3364369 RepID=UPI0037A9C00B